MKVKATQLGYYNNKRVRTDSVFMIKGDADRNKEGEITNPAFSKIWMTEIKPGKKQEVYEEEVTEDFGDDLESEPVGESTSDQEVI